MNKFMNMIIGTFITIFGLILWFNTDATIRTFSLYIGIIFLLVTVIGMVLIHRVKVHEIPYAQFAVTGILGLLFIFLPSLSFALVTTIFVFIFFLFAVFNGLKVFRSKYDNLFVQSAQIVIAILFISYAVVMLLNPQLGRETLANIIAFFMIMNGVSYFFIKKKQVKA